METLQRADTSDLAHALGLAEVDSNVISVDPIRNTTPSFQCFRSFGDVETVWRAIENNSSGSVYQRYDWCKCWFDVFSAHRNITPLIVVGSLGGEPCFLLPLYGETRALGFQVARIMGDDHCNIRMPLVIDHGLERFDILCLAKTDHFMPALIKSLKDQTRINALDLCSMPEHLDGTINPLVTKDAKPSELLLFSGPLSDDFEALKTVRRPVKSQRKSRRNLRQLSEIGEVTFEQVNDVAGLDHALACFFDQKRVRLTNAGILSAFETKLNREFIAELAHRSLDQRCELLDFQLLKVAGEPVAIAAGGRHKSRYSMALNSMTAESRFVTHGPGRLSVDHAVEGFCSQAIGFFDLGLGDNEYKRMWCDPVALVDLKVALNAKGAVYTFIGGLKREALRQVRQSPKLKKLAHRLRLILRRGL